MHGEAAAGEVVTAEQFIEWMEHGTNPPTIEEARDTLTRTHKTLVALIEGVETLRDEMTADADNAIKTIAYRAENAREYALLCAWSQRLMDLSAIAGEAAQR